MVGWALALVLLCACAPAAPTGDPEAGRQLYMQPTIDGAPGCITCHSPDPQAERIGPSHDGIVERARGTLESPAYTGSAKDVEGYLRESIVQPNAFVREGFPSGTMPSDYAELLSDQQVGNLIAFIRTLD